MMSQYSMAHICNDMEMLCSISRVLDCGWLWAYILFAGILTLHQGTGTAVLSIALNMQKTVNGM